MGALLVAAIIAGCIGAGGDRCFTVVAERAHARPRTAGMMYIGMTGPEGATLEYMDRHARMAEDILMRRGGRRRSRARAIVRVPGRLWRRSASMNQARGFLLFCSPGTSASTARSRSRSRIRAKLDRDPGRQ